jgi:cathepsin L
MTADGKNACKGLIIFVFLQTGALEGQQFRKTGKLVPLSEQNLIDCSSTDKYGNHGCNGGLMDAAFKYIKENHGVDTEEGYPYEGQQQACRYKEETKGAEVKGYVDIPTGNEKFLKTALATIGPVRPQFVIGSLEND